MKTTQSGRECRSLRRGLAGVKVDRRADDKSSIKGLAAVYYREGEPGTEYWLWDDMVERIMPELSIEQSKSSMMHVGYSTTMLISYSVESRLVLYRCRYRPKAWRTTFLLTRLIQIINALHRRSIAAT